MTTTAAEETVMPSTETPADRAAHPLGTAVVGCCTSAADLVARLGDPQEQAAVPLLRAECDRIHGGAATLVVVGEKKRGKSSLINALIGHDGLLPVDFDVATGVHLTVADAARLTATAYLDSVPTGTPIEVGQVHEYAAVDPQTQQPYRDDVQRVELGVPSDLLARGLVLIDTPGVGGLVAGHTEITMATLSRADALVLVVDGSSELTRSELHFLERASSRVDTVLFVLTKIDMYDAWPQILQRNQELLRQHAPRYGSAPWFAVSSRAKLDADAAGRDGDDDTAAARLAESNFTPLVDALVDEVAQQAEAIRLRNALYVAATVVEPVRARHHRTVRSLAQDPTLSAEVTAREAALDRLRRQDAHWRKLLSGRMKELEGVLRLGFQRHVNDLRALAEEKINTSKSDGLTEVPDDLEAGIRGIWMQLENAAQDGLTRITTELAQEFGEAGIAELAAELELPERIQRLPGLVEQAHDSRGLFAGLERLFPAASAGTLVFTVLSVLTGGLLIPAVAGIGLIAGLMGRRKRREELARRRGDANRYLNRVISELHTEVPPKIHESLVAAGRALAESLSGWLTNEQEKVRAELAEHQQDLAAAAADLAARRAQATADLAELTEVSRRITELRGYLGATG
ncbi:dynamin family protein [Solwaraspora sp. WMMD791]|uniref:dynamin family protein n=1 Tax=Solwaraspora sp. WMMD791 TaxID=3016086 RepID=UPI00249C7E14|nr:dynamin family protein [Solwaraspora sp. WMMD791]WFE29292.1 dynamin family protein [Solwaraspora sp. WMMD791]